MEVKAIKSKIITSGDDLFGAILQALKNAKLVLGNKDVFVVTSKVLSMSQGKIAQVKTEESFNKLVKKEADKIIGESQVTLTMKNGIYIPWAGIDRSNIKHGYAVIWPEKPFKSAQVIRSALKKKFKLKNLGVIISDSHCVPLRRGVSGIAIGYAGIRGVNDLRGKKDLYGNTLKVTQQNVVDMIASSAHLVMGEADEQTPFALIKDAPIVFTDKKINPKEPVITPDQCLFSPLYNSAKHICLPQPQKVE
jgi:coenzyme F420-0:L-glutamate ligase